MNWLYYLLEANLYLILFYTFYRVFLQQETFYNANRYYLLLSSLLAFLLPILQLGMLKPSQMVEQFTAATVIEESEMLAIVPTVATELETDFHFVDYLYPLYLGISLLFTLKLALDIAKIVNLWLKAKKNRKDGIIYVTLRENAAFSFFNWLFIHPHLAEKSTVINHEMVHIKQKHSYDILLFELLQIVSWSNPVSYLIKKDIKLIHEYIADELSTGSNVQKHEYAMFLIEHSFGVMPTALTNQIFNQSILKRRINMLNKKRTAGWHLLLILFFRGQIHC